MDVVPATLLDEPATTMRPFGWTRTPVAPSSPPRLVNTFPAVPNPASGVPFAFSRATAKSPFVPPAVVSRRPAATTLPSGWAVTEKK